MGVFAVNTYVPIFCVAPEWLHTRTFTEFGAFANSTASTPAGRFEGSPATSCVDDVTPLNANVASWHVPSKIGVKFTGALCDAIGVVAGNSAAATLPVASSPA